MHLWLPMSSQGGKCDGFLTCLNLIFGWFIAIEPFISWKIFQVNRAIKNRQFQKFDNWQYFCSLKDVKFFYCYVTILSMLLMVKQIKQILIISISNSGSLWNKKHKSFASLKINILIWYRKCGQLWLIHKIEIWISKW